MESGGRNSFDNMTVVTTSFLVDSILNQRQQQNVDVFENRLSGGTGGGSSAAGAGHPMEPPYGPPPHGFSGYQPPSAPPYLYGGERRIPKWERHGAEDELGNGGPDGPASPISPRYRMAAAGMDYLAAARREEMMTFGDLKSSEQAKQLGMDPAGLTSCMVAEAERKAVHTNQILPTDNNNNSKILWNIFHLSSKIF